VSFRINLREGSASCGPVEGGGGGKEKHAGKRMRTVYEQKKRSSEEVGGGSWKDTRGGLFARKAKEKDHRMRQE